MSKENSTIGMEALKQVPVQVSVELGRTQLKVTELSMLSKGSVVQLDQNAGELLNIFANGLLIAKGETVVINDCFGIRITEIINQ